MLNALHLCSVSHIAVSCNDTCCHGYHFNNIEYSISLWIVVFTVLCRTVETASSYSQMNMLFVVKSPIN